MAIRRDNGSVAVERPSDSGQHKALHGLTRSLISNMVAGVSAGFEKTLDLVGVGYRVAQTGQGITLSVMLSHTVAVEPPPGVTLTVEGNNRIPRSGDRQAGGGAGRRRHKEGAPAQRLHGQGH